MIPSFVLKKTLFGNGFQKESVLEYIALLQQQIQEKDPYAKLPPDTLKPAKVGGGFDKESVLSYIELLQLKLIELESAQ